ncbi:lysophospholipid acyltransferase family protein [Cognatilysobacter lacus]|uniref:lysophospholipid acyltransferase family protein n=1 Tax=Cognatilysobacter lacus TaxID=1643323 RepID=UPI00165A05EB|nr:lysophospholipid acyltransferase family protein [Lysobacter lacus]
MLRIVRVLALLVCALAVAVAQPCVMLVARRGHRAASVLPMLFHRTALRLLGLRVQVDGAPRADAQTAWLANHLSYLDVPVLGALLPARFVAKDEVRHWPLLGPLSRLQRTVFIGRRNVDAKAALDSMAGALAHGASLIVFPEGTTSDGDDVRPFRSPVFAMLGASPGVLVQPVTLAVTGPDAAARRAYAYIDDDTLATHLWAFLARARTDVRVTLHPPMRVDALGDHRKAAATAARVIVASALQAEPAAA